MACGLQIMISPVAMVVMGVTISENASNFNQQPSPLLSLLYERTTNKPELAAERAVNVKLYKAVHVAG